MALKVLRLYARLVITWSLLFCPSTAAPEIVPRARNPVEDQLLVKAQGTGELLDRLKARAHRSIRPVVDEGARLLGVN